MAIGQKDFQYDKFKTHFFQIEVGDAAGNNMTLLPPTLHKLVEKLEITETLAECLHSTQITITFIEGSREPFSQKYGVSSSSLYTDAQVPNSSGMLCDLLFSQIVAAPSISLPQIPEAIGAAIGLISDTLSSIGVLGSASPAPEKQLGDKEVAPKRAMKYVFEEKNMVRVSWGYREDLENVRKVSGRIQIVTSQFPESGHPKLVVTCLPSTSFLDQITPKKGITFYKQSLSGLDETTGTPVYTFEDMPTKDIVKQICDKAGMSCIVSENLLSPKVDKYHVKTIPAGKSFHQFFKEVAKSSGAYYIAFIDPKTNKDTIAMISRSEWEQKPIIPNDSLLYYKAPGSILKTANIKADFSSPTGTTITGTGANGQSTAASSTSGQESTVFFEGAQQADANPASGNVIPSAKALNDNVAKNDGYIAGKVINSPQADDPQTMLENSKAVAGCQGKLIMLDFTAMGFPRLRPGVVKFSGLGQRYTGQYNITTITHTIDSNGYDCRGLALGNATYGGTGVNIQKATKGQESDTNMNLFKSSALDVIKDPSKIGAGFNPKSLAEGSAMDEYNKTILG